MVRFSDCKSLRIDILYDNKSAFYHDHIRYYGSYSYHDHIHYYSHFYNHDHVYYHVHEMRQHMFQGSVSIQLDGTGGFLIKTRYFAQPQNQFVSSDVSFDDEWITEKEDPVLPTKTKWLRVLDDKVQEDDTNEEDEVKRMTKTRKNNLVHKSRLDDFKTINPKNYTSSINGRKALTLEEKKKLGGGYNALLQTALPEKLRGYNPAEETADSSHRAFTTTFPRGFALEVLQVYSGPRVIVYKFRHWGFMEGPFKGHSPTGELVEFYGMGIFELDEESKIVKVELFFDRGELLGGLMKGGASSDSVSADAISSNCPFLKNTG
ncbi:pathogen-related protein-like [Cornus florida]|uniref:pathogen-related protein-like n=1 Tax=Cornus florida TaxID=4283 RepID=UPI0028969AA1|nr:pathogen-related protein-like [Cornus florida]